MDRKRGMGFWPFILVIIVISLLLSEDLLLDRADAYTYPQLIQDIEEKNESIEQIIIVPNSEVPTGTVRVQWEDGSTTQCHVTDVNEVKALLLEEEMDNWQITDTQRDTWLDKNGGSLLVAIVILVVFMIFVNSQNGGANAKMANFGKSRAKMSDESAKQTTFKKVAGLEEEKEELQEVVDFL